MWHGLKGYADRSCDLNVQVPRGSGIERCGLAAQQVSATVSVTLCELILYRYPVEGDEKGSDMAEPGGGRSDKQQHSG